MTRKPGMVFTTVLLCAQAAGAADLERAIPWSQLAREVEGRKIRMVAPGGAQIEGRVASVGPEQLQVRITKTSDKTTRPRGLAGIGRSEVTVLQVVRHGVRWRIIGTIAAPLLVGVAAGGVVRHTGADNLAVAAGLTVAGMVGGGVGGYYLGKRADRRVVTIRIIDEKR